jgi:hypothetical protein
VAAATRGGIGPDYASQTRISILLERFKQMRPFNRL